MPNPKSNFFNGGYASRVEGKDASGEYLTAAQRKENFKRQAVSFINGTPESGTTLFSSRTTSSLTLVYL